MMIVLENKTAIEIACQYEPYVEDDSIFTAQYVIVSREGR